MKKIIFLMSIVMIMMSSCGSTAYYAVMRADEYIPSPSYPPSTVVISSEPVYFQYSDAIWSTHYRGYYPNRIVNVYSSYFNGVDGWCIVTDVGTMFVVPGGRVYRDYELSSRYNVYYDRGWSVRVATRPNHHHHSAPANNNYRSNESKSSGRSSTTNTRTERTTTTTRSSSAPQQETRRESNSGSDRKVEMNYKRNSTTTTTTKTEPSRSNSSSRSSSTTVEPSRRSESNSGSSSRSTTTRSSSSSSSSRSSGGRR